MDNNIQKTYDELSKPTESEKLQDELEPIVHPAMETRQKEVKEKTLEDEKQKEELKKLTGEFEGPNGWELFNEEDNEESN